jgi:hypothetical protein
VHRLKALHRILAAVSADSSVLATRSAWLARALQRSGRVVVSRDARLMKNDAVRLSHQAGDGSNGLSAILGKGNPGEVVGSYIRLLRAALDQQRLEARFVVMTAARLLGDPLEVDGRDARFVSRTYAAGARAARSAMKLAREAWALKVRHPFQFQFRYEVRRQ